MSLSKQNAAARVAQLPLVRSAFTNLLDLYGDAKSGNPGFGSVCEGLESSVKQLASVVSHRVSPAITKLNPQVSLANDVACKTLDWLEATFPVLQTSSDQLVAGLRSKVMEMQDAQPGDRSLMGRAISVSSMGLASALNITEALVDRMLPPLEEEKKEEDVLVEDSEDDSFGRKYSVRLVTLSITLCRRTIQLAGAKMQSAQIMAALSTSSGQLRILQTSWMALTWSLEQLPPLVQQQIGSAIFNFTQLYNLRVAPQSCSKPDRGVGISTKVPVATQTPHKVAKNSPHTSSNWRARRPASISVIVSRSTQLSGKGMGRVEGFH
ncbi:perilipin-2-like isoform X2 [Corythoichthys intestinalis]|uniref:perilipin-2-like isoform X2 n=1 Tax=Corythoichthys intestinalis TaxID=161448 RepID=UPI0025A6496A|nr:perilipin-2-like isoform X2 [Corythoichthys intestinalis]